MGNSDGLRAGGWRAARAAGPSWLANWPTGFLADSPHCDTLHLGACESSAMLASSSYHRMTHRKHRNNCWVSSAQQLLTRSDRKGLRRWGLKENRRQRNTGWNGTGWQHQRVRIENWKGKWNTKMLRQLHLCHLLLEEDSTGLDSDTLFNFKVLLHIITDICSVSCLSCRFYNQTTTKMIAQDSELDILQLKHWCNS